MTRRAGLMDIAARMLKLFDRHGPDDDVGASLAAAQTFLVLRYERALGSAINAAVLFEALRRVKPDAHVAVVCNRLSFDVLKGNPFIDELILTVDPRSNFARAVFGALRGIRLGKRRFDCLITSGDDRPRIEAMALMLGRGLRIGHGPGRTFHVPFQGDATLSVIADHLRVVQAIGEIGAPPAPRVYYTPSDTASVREKLIGMGWDGERPLFVFASQGSGGQPTEWYEDRFVNVADRLADQYLGQVAFTGSPDQASAIDRIRAGMRNGSVNLAGLTTIPELSALISMSDLLVTLDTGTMHFGRGVETPMVVIASAWQPAHLWLPSDSDRVRILRRDTISCTPCGEFYCATRACLDEIIADDVTAAAFGILKKFPPGRSSEMSCDQSERPPFAG